MKAYKATNHEMQCRGFQFELGVKYTHTGKVEPCKRGFHACRRVFDIGAYYPFESSRIFEVKIEDFIEQGAKLCARHITLIRELTFHEVMSMANLDENGKEFEPGSNKNLGFFNKGNNNKGNYNKGNYNKGNNNRGNNNKGNYNIGNYNIGNYNIGNNKPE